MQNLALVLHSIVSDELGVEFFFFFSKHLYVFFITAKLSQALIFLPGLYIWFKQGSAGERCHSCVFHQLRRQHFNPLFLIMAQRVIRSSSLQEERSLLVSRSKLKTTYPVPAGGR